MKDDKLEFRHKDVNDEETKEKYRNDPFVSIALLLNVAAALLGVANRFTEGNLSLFSELCLSKDLWEATNYARLWPEENHDRVDHLLQDALSHISDAHYMIEDLYCIGPGEDYKRYKNAFPKIAQDIRFALQIVREAIELIDEYIDTNLGGDGEKDNTRDNTGEGKTRC